MSQVEKTVVYALHEKSRVGKLIFIALVVFYIALMLYRPALGPDDEYHFLPSLQSGKFFPLYGEDFYYLNTFEIARFTPLIGQEYNLVAIFSNSPFWYFVLNSLELLGFSILFLRLLREYSSNSSLNYLAALFVLLLPATAYAFFKLLFVERSLVLLFSAFVVSYVSFQKKAGTVFFVLALVLANVAMYSKEPVFLPILVFSAGHLLLTRNQSSRFSKWLDGLLILSTVIYVGVYLTLVFPHRTIFYGESLIDSSLLVRLRYFLNFCFFTDPVIMLIALPLAGWRAHRLFIRHDSPHPILDPMLAAGMAYVSVFLAMGIYRPYYLLPAYIFILPPLVHYLALGKLSKAAWRILFVVSGIALAANTLPMTIHYLSYGKYVPINFNKTLDFLIQDIRQRNDGKRASIFLDGVDRGAGRDIHYIVGEFIKHKGLSIRQFDLKSNIEAYDTSPFIRKRSPFDRDEDVRAVDPEGAYAHPEFPFTVFQPGPLPQMQRGDYLVVSPHSAKGYDAAYIERLKSDKDYTLVFHTESRFAVPRFDLKIWVRYFLLKMLGTEQKGGGLVVSGNLWNWPDYYVFVRN